MSRARPWRRIRRAILSASHGLIGGIGSRGDMGHCVQTAIVKAPCQSCGGRAEKMHQPVFVRGTFCPKCCPVCGAEATAMAKATPAPAPLRGVVAVAPVRKREAAAPTQGATQWKDAGWGHRPDDPWVHDRDRHGANRPRWIPSRPGWFGPIRFT